MPAKISVQSVLMPTITSGLYYKRQITFGAKVPKNINTSIYI